VILLGMLENGPDHLTTSLEKGRDIPKQEKYYYKNDEKLK